MHSQSLLSVLLAAGATASNLQEYAPASDLAAFGSAVSALVAGYIPTSVMSQLAPRITSAAAAAGITGDASNLLLQALEAPTTPAWLGSAVPSVYGPNFAAMTAAIASMRPTAGATAATGLPTNTLIVATTTNGAGSTITTSFTSSLPASGSGSGTTSHAASSTSSSGTSAAGSGTSSGTATSTSKPNGAAPTGVARQAVGGVVALVGLAVAL